MATRLDGYFLFAAMLLFMVIGVVASLKNFMHPPILFEATDKGIVTFYKGSDYAPPGFLVPWDRIVGLEHRSLDLAAAGGGFVKIPVIAIRVNSLGWSFPTLISYAGQSDNDLIYLDARAGSPAGVSLLKQLDSLAQKYAGPQYIKRLTETL